ncbi:MAG: class I SAM-dependent methyltransferase [Planctomycetia bacterium]|nr:class I SAM-dependent methyltransferase [Planctomycetia bacterium]
MRAAELPTPAAATGIYTEAYFFGQEYGDYLADRQVHVQNFAARWRDMRRLADDVNTVFEIGCAYGLFLEYASAHGARAAGIDVCGEAVAHAASELGQRVIVGDFLTSPIAAGEYQAYCLWDTIEHLPRPDLVVERIERLLPPSGWLFLTTGDVGSPLARLRGRRWRMIHPPTHLQYFSRRTMTQFLARHGFAIVEAKAISVYRTLHSVLSSLTALRKGFTHSAASAISRLIPIGGQNRMGMWVNSGDIMFVAAQKRASLSCGPSRAEAESQGPTS